MKKVEPFTNGGELQKGVIKLGRTMGWKIAHFRSIFNGKTNRWETPVGADGQGFPDLLLVHPDHQVLRFREIKGKYETLRPEQEMWGSWLIDAGLDWGVWRPAQWDTEIVPLLTFGRGTTV
jgi:hypothetical protein